jgi:hypothetical protein
MMPTTKPRPASSSAARNERDEAACLSDERRAALGRAGELVLSQLASAAGELPAAPAPKRAVRLREPREDDTLDDAIIVAGVCETEHHEIAAYEGLIVNAQALGEDEVARLVEQNLADERSMLEKGKQMAEQIARGMAPVA